MRTTPALLVSCCVALAACGGTADVSDTPVVDAGPTPEAADGSDAVDAVGAWVLREAEPAVPVATGLPFELTVEQRGDGALRVSGHAPCNIFGGTVIADGGGWEVEGGDYTVDGAGCEPAVMAAEQAYPDALRAVTLVTDGLLQLDTGCQGYEGSWRFADDGSIALDSLERGVEDREPCTPNGAALADEVAVSLFEVIDVRGFTATMEDGTLPIARTGSS